MKEKEKMNTKRLLYTNKDVDKLVDDLLPLVHKVEKDFKNNIAIYGAGFVGTWAAPYLKSLGANISCFLDRDSNKSGLKIDNISVLAPCDGAFLNINSMFIAARHAIKEVMMSMEGKNINMISFDGYYVVKNYERYTFVRDNFFTDDKSIETFNALLIAMLTGSTQSCRAVMEKDMYFSLPEFSGTFDDIFVDAGAFVGDTVERFIWENLGTFKHLYAFEPGFKQFNALKKRVKRLCEEWAIDEGRVDLVKAGLSSVTGRMSCTFLEDFPLRHGLCLDNNEKQLDEVHSSAVYSLDSYLEGKKVSFIKADVEGMELELLKGAQKTIQNCKPKMALCVYHYPNDLFEIAEYVRALDLRYKFYLRQHAPIFGDFVLYCYID